MTRVNLVNVEDLADQHLFAEWREIKMVPASLRRSLKTRVENNVLSDIPGSFTLGTGHVLFFYNKMKFLFKRYDRLTYELKNRDFDISVHNPTSIFFEDIPSIFTELDWEPRKDEIKISADRILEKIKMRPNWYRHYGSVNTPEYFSALYNLQLDLIAA